MSAFTDQLNAINHNLSWQQAKTMVDLYTQQKNNLLSGTYASNISVLLSYETFNLAAIQSILSQSGVAGLRIYMGMDTSNNTRHILVGVDVNGGDIIMNNGSCSLTKVLEMGQRYP